MIFLSSQHIGGGSASLLLTELRNIGLNVDHSPLNPAFGHDERWQSWYAQGLRTALESVSLFVSVIDKGWDSSTWMAMESAQAFNSVSTRDSIRFWNPDQIVVKVQEMRQYLTSELPRDLIEAAAEIEKLAMA
ncbi:hypothetical protein AAFN60_21360 [Roseibacillus persicicus]|uniref:hypothetical protein n=1 Tax=Roseibacillus persicicus TaxID=454148 RepID=UPI00398B9FD8